MSFESGHYSIEELLVLRGSPLVTKPDLPPQMEQWITQPAVERRNLQNSQSHVNAENDSKYRSTESRRSRGDSIVLGPPQMSFASSLHSPTLRKSGNKDSVVPSSRNRPSPPNDDVAVPTSPQEEEEEGWSKVRSTGRGNAARGSERRGVRGERRGGREPFDGPPAKGTGFRNHREGESQNWRSERAEPQSTEQMKNGRYEERVESLEEDGEFVGGGGGGGDTAGGKEHSAEEFEAWITKMRGGNPKSEEVNDTPNEDNHENGVSIEQPKIDKSKIVDVDSLFALDAPSLDENSSKGPSSSVFFDSAPTTGRASRFRTLFAQHTVPQSQQLPPEPGNRLNMDRRQSVPMYSGAPKPGASMEDREGFQRIMAMLGGGGGKPNMPNFMDKSPPLQSLPQPPMQDGPGQGESKDEFFKRLLRQGQPMGGNGPPPFTSPPMMSMNRNNGPMDQQLQQPRLSPTDMEANMQNMHQRMNRPQPPQLPRSQHSDPRFPPFDLHSPPPPLPPPPQGAPWMHPPPGFSPPNSRFPFPGPPLSPGGLPPPPPPGGYGPPPPGMIPYGGPPPPPPGFGRGGVFSPPPPPPGQDGWHPPPGFGGGFYQDGDGRER